MKISKAFDVPKRKIPNSRGSAGYDNQRENIDPHIKTQVVSTKEITLSDGSPAGFVKNDANGVLSGGNAGASSVEGTDVLSTGEVGGTKYLREDGDGTCSWQTIAAGGDVSADANLTDDAVVFGDGGAKKVKTSTATLTQVNAAITHSSDNSQAHSDYLVNNANDTSSGTITAAGFVVSGDASSADTAYVPMVLYNTDATPPAASGFPVGTLYVQYTA